MNLIQLRYFYESAQSENFSKTAEKYMVPTSSVSAAIKRLEEELGILLFDRNSNRVTLNPAGQLLANALGNAFGEVERAISDIQSNTVSNPEIRILVRARRSFITNLLIEYRTLHSNVRFRMQHELDTESYDDFDIVIDEKNETLHSEMEHFLFLIETLCIKAGKEAPLCDRKLTMNDLKKYPFIMMRGNNHMIRILRQHGRRCGFEPNIAFLCEDRQCLLQCVESGMGLTIGSRRALGEEIQSKLSPLDVSDFNEVQQIYVYHRKTQATDVTLTDFLQFLSKRRHLELS
ncbi:MAG: LysR family transcriptional regulator [Clostridia bacterium]|nr:LysR family transcriptional regulator [Clostridia bacterium]